MADPPSVDRAALVAMMAAATPGPWFGCGRHVTRTDPAARGMGFGSEDMIASVAELADGLLIAAAVNALPALLAALDAAEAEIARLRAVIATNAAIARSSVGVAAIAEESARLRQALLMITDRTCEYANSGSRTECVRRDGGRRDQFICSPCLARMALGPVKP